MADVSDEVAATASVAARQALAPYAPTREGVVLRGAASLVTATPRN
jgi:hypothetical protein